MFFLNEKTGRNRRKYPRIDTRNLIAVHLEERFVFNLVNISENGVQFTSSKEFSKKETLSVAINLAEVGAQVLALSRVVWAREFSCETQKVYRVGLMFLDIGTKDLFLLRKFIWPILKAA